MDESVMYFTFLFKDLVSFAILEKFFYELKTDKENIGIDMYSLKWLKYIVENHMSFFTGDNEESWSFESMIGCIELSEYKLVSCRIIENNIGILEWTSDCYPYGSTDALRALIESYGFKIKSEYLGFMPPKEYDL